MVIASTRRKNVSLCKVIVGLCFIFGVGFSHVFGMENQDQDTIQMRGLRWRRRPNSWNLTSLSSKKILKEVPKKTAEEEEEEGRSTVASNGTEDGETCGESLIGLKKGQAGMIQSPNYPKYYAQGLNCEWILETEPENQVELTFFDVRIKSPSFAGEPDSLLVTLNNKKEFAQRYSGDLNSGTPFNVMSETNRIVLNFKSSITSFGASGFKIGYFVRKRGQKPGILQTIGTNNQAVAGESFSPPVLAAACQVSPIHIPRLRKSFNETFIRRRHQVFRRMTRTNPNPHMVALILDNKHFCSGTLIRDNFVMTSAHCVEGVEKIEMIFGTPDITLRDAGVQKRFANSSSVYAHPQFDKSTGSHDISLIRLSRPVLFTKYVKAARLPHWSNIGVLFENSNVEISGWGDSEVGSVYSTARGMSLRMAPNAACRSSLHTGLNGLMMCSRGNGATVMAPNGTCQVDSGSAIIARCGDNVNSAGQTTSNCRNPFTTGLKYWDHMREDSCFLRQYLPRNATIPAGANNGTNSTGHANGGKPGHNRPQKPANNHNNNNRPQKPGQSNNNNNNNQNQNQKPQKPAQKPQKPGNNQSQRPQKPGNNQNQKPQKPANNHNNHRPQKPAQGPNKPRPQKPGHINQGNGTMVNGTMVNANGTMVNGTGLGGHNKPHNNKPGHGHKPHNKPHGKPGGNNNGTTNGNGTMSDNGGKRPQKPGKGQKPNPGTNCPIPPANSRGRQCDYFSQSPAVVIGLTSFGSCQEGFAFTRITANLDFIYSTIKSKS